MKLSRNSLSLYFGLAALVCTGMFFTSCRLFQHSSPPPFNEATGTGTDTSGRLRIGELLTVTYSDLATSIPPFSGRIKEDGTITLTQNQDFVAAGKTVAELEKQIHARYVPAFFRNLTVTVVVQDRFFYVDGQVRSPNRLPYVGDITVLGAIASVGGFTDFAQPKKVQIIRANNRKEIVNCKKAKDHPELDVPIFPGDRIFVPRKIW